MANYVEAFASKLDWAMPFQRTGKFPLDRTDLFTSYADAVKYAAGNVDDPDSRGLCGSSYVGQIITVFENDVVTSYKIEANRTLGQIGAAYLGDGKSVVLADGVFALKGFAEAVAEGSFEGKQPRINAAGELEWYKPDTSTVAGLQETVGALSQTVGQLGTDVQGLKDGKVDKEEGKGLSTNDFTNDEKNKLGGIAAGAQVNVIEGIRVNGEVKVPVEKVVDLTVPTKLSDLTNDQNFVDSTVNNLTNYYLKTETYSRTEVDGLLAAMTTINILRVDALPTENISTSTIYLVPKTDSDEDDIYNEYIYVESDWELIGNTQLDLSNYLQKDGDGSAVTVVFTAAGVRELPASAESLSIILGKIVKYLADLKDVAFTGDYNDLINKPQSVQRTVLTIAAGALSVSAQLLDILTATAYDAVTGEVVLVDQTFSGTGVEFSITEAYTNDITIVVSSLV